MELLIGKVISKLRKERGITQEELANVVGVSTPAVSKWESGISYPDITLLPVISRYFNISTDELLSYKQDLTKDEVQKLVKGCAEQFEKVEVMEAIKFCEEFLREYPNNHLLKLRIASLLFLYIGKAEKEKLQDTVIKKAIELSREASKSLDLEVKQSALYYLSNLYNVSGKSKEAIEILEELPKVKFNPDMLLASAYMAQNEYEKARNIQQKNLYNDIANMYMSIFAMFDLAIKEKNYEFAIKLAEKYKSIIKLFDLDKVMASASYLMFSELYTSMKDENLTLKALEEYVEILINEDRISLANNEYFNTLEKGEKTVSEEYLKLSLKQAIITDKRFDFIKSSDRYKEGIRKLSL